MTLADLQHYADTARILKDGLIDLEEYQFVLDDHLACAEIARENRDRAILHALSEGYTHQQIADATGLTRGRVGQIANRKDGK
jgi:uncharacterized protein YerC